MILLLRRSLLLTSFHRARSSTASQLLPTKCNFSSSASPSPSEIATRRLYRILQRQCKEFSKSLPSHPSGETMFLLQPPIESRNSGNNRVLSIKTVDADDDVLTLLQFFREWNREEDDVDEWFASVKKEAKSLDPSDEKEMTMWSTSSSLQNTIRYAFRNASLDVAPDGNDPQNYRKRMNKFAIRAVRSLTEQAAMWHLTSVSYDKGVRVVATSKCIGDSLMNGAVSNKPKTKYRFNYRIRVENLSDQDTFQLLGRHWHIQERDSRDGKTPVGVPVIVDAPNSGAVGRLPVLEPGQAFEYISGCELETAIGTMEGSFRFAKVPTGTPSAPIGNTIPAFSSPDKFEVPVKPFPLVADV